MKYTFEKYEFNERGRNFIGYYTVNASSNEEAQKLAQSKVGEHITLIPIYVPQDPQ
jgi:hypothetical protein